MKNRNKMVLAIIVLLMVCGIIGYIYNKSIVKSTESNSAQELENGKSYEQVLKSEENVKKEENISSVYAVSSDGPTIQVGAMPTESITDGLIASYEVDNYENNFGEFWFNTAYHTENYIVFPNNSQFENSVSIDADKITVEAKVQIPYEGSFEIVAYDEGLNAQGYVTITPSGYKDWDGKITGTEWIPGEFVNIAITNNSFYVEGILIDDDIGFEVGNAISIDFQVWDEENGVCAQDIKLYNRILTQEEIQQNILASIYKEERGKAELWSKTQTVELTITSTESGLASNAELQYGWSISKETEPTKWESITLTSYSEGATKVKHTIQSKEIDKLHGKYYLWVKPINVKNIQGKTATITGISENAYWIDSTGPEITIEASNTNSWSKTQNVNVTISDNEVGLNHIQEIQYGWSTSKTEEPTEWKKEILTQYYEKTVSFVAISTIEDKIEGKYYLWVKPINMKDNLGNVQTETKISENTYWTDNIEPQIQIEEKAINSWEKTCDIEVVITDKGSGIADGANIKYGWSTSKGVEPKKWEDITLTSYGEGTEELSFIAKATEEDALNGRCYLWVKPINVKDNLGNVQTNTKISKNTYLIDSVGPTIQIGKMLTDRVSDGLVAYYEAYNYALSKNSFGKFIFDSIECKENYFVIPNNINYKNRIFLGLEETTIETKVRIPYEGKFEIVGLNEYLEKVAHIAITPQGYNEKEITQIEWIPGEYVDISITNNSLYVEGILIDDSIGFEINKANSIEFQAWDEPQNVYVKNIKIYDRMLTKEEIEQNIRVFDSYEQRKTEIATWSKTHSEQVTITDKENGIALNAQLKYGWSMSDAQEPEEWRDITLLDYAEGDTEVSFTVQVTDEEEIEGKYYLWIKPIQLNDMLGNAQIDVEVSGNVYWIDNVGPRATVKGNKTKWTTQDVTLEIKVEGNWGAPLHEIPYSFDGGETWQAEATKTYDKNTSNIIIKVRDSLENIYTHEEINITKIDKTSPTIEISIEEPESEMWSKTYSGQVTINDDQSGLASNAQLRYGWSLSKDTEPTQWKEITMSNYSDGEKMGTFAVEPTEEEKMQGKYYLWVKPIMLQDVVGNTTITIQTSENTYWIDNVEPKVTIEGNPTEWTEENVTLEIKIEDDIGAPLHELAYSFDGGQTWQAEATKTYDKNTSGITIKVRDSLENTYTHEEINITRIRKGTSIAITNVPEKTQYEAHENFDSSGMEVTITYDNGNTEKTTDYTILNGTDLTCLVNEIEIQYNKNTDLKAKVQITVGHDEETIEGKDPACTETGLEEKIYCIICNEVIKEHKEIPALNHSFTNYISNNDATCEEDGTKTAICDREGCDETHTKIDEGSALGHNYEDGECTECGEEEPKLQISSNIYHIKNQYISNVYPETIERVLKNNIQTNATQVNIYTKNGELVADDKTIATGMTIEFKFRNEVKTLTIVVNGDTNGNGTVELADMILANRKRLGKNSIQGEFLLAADFDKNGKVSFIELLKINKLRLKKEVIL